MSPEVSKVLKIRIVISIVTLYIDRWTLTFRIQILPLSSKWKMIEVKEVACHIEVG